MKILIQTKKGYKELIQKLNKEELYNLCVNKDIVLEAEYSDIPEFIFFTKKKDTLYSTDTSNSRKLYMKNFHVEELCEDKDTVTLHILHKTDRDLTSEEFIKIVKSCLQLGNTILRFEKIDNRGIELCFLKLFNSEETEGTK